MSSGFQHANLPHPSEVEVMQQRLKRYELVARRNKTTLEKMESSLPTLAYTAPSTMDEVPLPVENISKKEEDYNKADSQQSNYNKETKEMEDLYKNRETELQVERREQAYKAKEMYAQEEPKPVDPSKGSTARGW